MKIYTSFLCLVILVIFIADASAQSIKWKPVPGHIMSRWAKDVSPENVLPKYPRPQMRRDEWMNLNGLWQFDTLQTDNMPFGKKLSGTILVPFPIESALSGVMRKSDYITYRRTFILPENWKGKHVLLHFGAVDWESTVFINGKKIGTHKGGYDPFSFDITSALHPSGEQEIIVRVFDPTNNGAQPCGKQSNNPGGIFYTSTTGIWQTVWLEPVNKNYIQNIRLIPDIDDSTITVNTDGIFNSGFSIEAKIFDGNKLVREKETQAGKSLVIKIPNEKLWSPDNPFLYNLNLSLIENRKTVDVVKSYFGMREISIGKDKKGITRILLNKKFIFLDGPLDQGFWPGGIYTAPTDEALKHDIQVEKELGFNMVRKHVKVEPQRWYYWCDKLGLLVWQDMPSAFPNGYEKKRTEKTDKEFKSELERMIKTHWNHPSIMMWVVFNEGWGQHDTKQLVHLVKKLDPYRLVDDASGWTDKNVGDIIDMHNYPGPGSPKPEANRAAVLGEFGGLGLPVKNHLWENKHWGYRDMHNFSDLFNHYKKLFEKVWVLKNNPGLSAAVYTQLTDVETEVNGLMTYDRKVIKIDPKKAYAVNHDEISALPIIEAQNHLFIKDIKVNLKNYKKEKMYYTLNGTEPNRRSYVYKEPIVLTKTSILKVKTYDSKGMESSTVSEKFVKTKYWKAEQTTGNFSNGIRYKYYTGKWDSLPDFYKLQALKGGIVKNFEIDSIKHSPNFYGILFSGYLKIPAKGIYTFYISSDDGSKLLIDNKIVVNNDGLHSEVQKFGEAALEKGFHKIELLYFQGPGGQALSVRLEGPSIKEENVPGSMLFN